MVGSTSARWVPGTIVAIGIGIGACGDDGGGVSADDSTSTGAAETAGVPTGPGPTTGETTSGADGTGTTGDGDSSGSTGGEPVSACEDLGLPIAAFTPGTGADWGRVAGDFTVETTFGVWNLAEAYSGCESYVFFNDVGDGASTSLRNTMSAELFSRSAANVHYFFLTSAGDSVAGADDWQTRVGSALAGVSKAEQEHWTSRVHFVTDDPAAIAGSVGEFLAAQDGPPLFAIDRAQTWDNPGYTPSAAALGYVSRYYNFRFDQDQWLASLDATSVPMIDEVAFAPDCVPGDPCFDVQNGPFSNSNNWQVWPATFPDAATMAGFDTMDLVVTATCGPDAYADCGHWDYEAMVNLCGDDTCATTQEVARWITPYSRPGTRRWVIDMTPLLGLVAAGGTQYFNFGMVWNMNPSTWDLRFVLRNEGRGEASRTVEPAFTGNRAFNDAYNDEWMPLSFTPPPGTTRVELVAIISGHGQDTGNCAEWCNHQHEFTVNGTDVHLREFPGQVVEDRCAEAVDDGVIPGQGGNWTPGRAGWCPGLPVQPWVVDITDQVAIGTSNTLDYRGLYQNVPVTGNRGRIRLSSYLAYYQ
jgi:hypothetical protein